MIPPQDGDPLMINQQREFNQLIYTVLQRSDTEKKWRNKFGLIRNY
jgi:hypothetical protein